MYFVVANIPLHFHSKDLRNYFSYLTERNAFECFHYYHRKTVTLLNYLQENETIFLKTPDDEYASLKTYSEFLNCFVSKDVDISKETSKSKKLGVFPTENEQFIDSILLNLQNIDLENDASLKMKENVVVSNLGYFCFVNIKNEFSEEFRSIYYNKCWVSFTGEVFPNKCIICNIEPLVNSVKNHQDNKDDLISNYCLRKKPGHDISFGKIEKLIDFQMGLALPLGNVGTSDTFLKSQLQQCKLPSSLIKKLGLDFQPKISKKCHNQVHLDYGTSIMPNSLYGSHNSTNSVFTSNGDLIPGYFDVKFNKKLDINPVNSTSPIIETVFDKESDEDVEKWDKYDEVYEDVRHREMAKDKLFESDMEQVWEKGGSGLVFWTDAQFWRQEDNESEESDADDWDLTGDNSVDMHDKASINFLKDIKMNKGKNSFFANEKEAERSMDKYVQLVKKMREARAMGQNDQTEILDKHAYELGLMFPFKVRRRLKKKAKQELKESRTNSFRKRSKKKTSAVEQHAKKNCTLDKDQIKAKKVVKAVPSTYGDFESYSNGVGSRLMRSQGWQKGAGLGKDGSGIVHPVNVHSIAKYHMKREGIGFRVKKSKKHHRLKETDSNLNVMLKSESRGRHDCTTEKINDASPDALHSKGRLNNSLPDDRKHEVNLQYSLTKSLSNQHLDLKTSSNVPKSLYGLDLYPHQIKFQKASSLGS